MVAGLLGALWLTVFVSGGTRTAWPHLFYLPVVAAVIPLGRRGGITAGVAATTELEQGLGAHLAAELDRAIPEGDGLADVAVLREALDHQRFQMAFQLGQGDVELDDVSSPR